MKIIIDVASNGFRVKTRHKDPEDRSYDENLVIEEEDTFDSSKDAEADAMQRLLWVVMECVGYCDGKYDKKRVRVIMEHGDCYDCQDKECSICADARDRCDCEQCNDHLACGCDPLLDCTLPSIDDLAEKNDDKDE